MPRTGTPPWVKLNVLLVSVDGFIASLNVVVMFAPISTSVVPFEGTLEMTTGAVTSRTPVVKVHT